ncbi:hypothetical protein Q5H93_19600 [Hymenobacter sp. ASUV-10]|uniref:Uncharacterized protein n=1 Tax=Hymenobacter aranciens TaxID=3063996 RepID=A0ABT9BFC9_9BACT|nr:hypothetical protein [Hymenobacter sp. ASUV-10]MDO7876961.1 hypothetical protein [Hymenobacter sp. ASUV-10]
MSRPLLAVLPLSSMPVAQKITKGIYILPMYEASAGKFPKTYDYTQAEMQEALDDLVKAHGATQGKSKVAYAQQEAAETRFDQVFGAYRDWANRTDVAYNNKVNIELLGLDPSRETANRPSLDAPVLQKPTGEQEGELDLVCEPFGDFTALVWFVAYGDEQPADDEYRFCTGGTRLRQKLTLESGRVAWIRVLAITTAGCTQLSAAVKRRVL